MAARLITLSRDRPVIRPWRLWALSGSGLSHQPLNGDRCCHWHAAICPIIGGPQSFQVSRSFLPCWDSIFSAMDCAMFSIFSFRGIPSATSTWKSQLLPTMQSDCACVVRSAASPGSLAALRPERAEPARHERRAVEPAVDETPRARRAVDGREVRAAHEGVDHRPRLLRRRATVQVDQPATLAHGARQDREVRLDSGDVEQGHQAVTYWAYPCASISEASSAPPSRTMRPSKNTWTKSGFT